jgi:hypothetical protein
MILLCLFQESKNIIFTCGDAKNHSWPSPLVTFSVPTRENNVLLLSFHCTVILHCFHEWTNGKVNIMFLLSRHLRSNIITMSTVRQ